MPSKYDQYGISSIGPVLLIPTPKVWPLNIPGSTKGAIPRINSMLSSIKDGIVVGFLF